MLGLAVRNRALLHNPVRELERVSQRKKKGSTATPLEELPRFLERARSDEYLMKWDTVDLIVCMIASGWRVAEVCALDARTIDFEAGTAAVEAQNIRVKGQGIVRQPFAKQISPPARPISRRRRWSSSSGGTCASARTRL